jgi:hypothetical protein
MGTDYKTWTDENPRHAWALEKMSDGPFKGSLVNQLQLQGTLSAKQMSVLWEKADELERLSLGEIRVPKLRKNVTVDARITKASEVDKKGDLVYQVYFTTDLGWKGRFDILSDMALIERISTRASDQVKLRGRVAWVHETFVVLESDKVTVELG